MKKYDLYIAGAYATLLLTTFILVFYKYNVGVHYNGELTNLFNTPISKVVINDFKNEIKIIKNDFDTSSEEWFFKGLISPNEIKALKIKDNTLYINYSGKRDVYSSIKLFVKNDVVVEINNSPQVKIDSSRTLLTSAVNLKKLKESKKTK